MISSENKCKITLYNQESHEFEKAQEGKYARVWKEEKKRRKDIIILQSQKQNKNFEWNTYTPMCWERNQVFSWADYGIGCILTALYFMKYSIHFSSLKIHQLFYHQILNKCFSRMCKVPVSLQT